MSAVIETRKLLNVRDVCALLGISKPTLYHLIHSGALASLTIAGRRRFTLGDVERYIAARLSAEREAM